MRFAFRLVAVALVVACSTVATGSDPALVRAEQTLATSLDVVDAFVRLDFDQAAPCRAAGVPVSASCSALEAALPGTHATADGVRTLAPVAFEAGAGAVTVYREAVAAARAIAASNAATPDERAAAEAKVSAALATMNAALANLATYVAKAQSALSSWKGGVR